MIGSERLASAHFLINWPNTRNFLRVHVSRKIFSDIIATNAPTRTDFEKMAGTLRRTTRSNERFPPVKPLDLLLCISLFSRSSSYRYSSYDDYVLATT